MDCLGAKIVKHVLVEAIKEKGAMKKFEEWIKEEWTIGRPIMIDYICPVGTHIPFRMEGVIR